MTVETELKPAGTKEIAAFKKQSKVTPELILGAIKVLGEENEYVIGYLTKTQEKVFNMADPIECETLGELGKPWLNGGDVFFNRNFSNMMSLEDYVTYKGAQEKLFGSELILAAKYVVGDGYDRQIYCNINGTGIYFSAIIYEDRVDFFVSDYKEGLKEAKKHCTERTFTRDDRMYFKMLLVATEWLNVQGFDPSKDETEMIVQALQEITDAAAFM